MLDAEANRRERILDLVRHLARHFSPGEDAGGAGECRRIIERDDATVGRGAQQRELHANLSPADCELALLNQDRKSTRLNSSHSQISYAVFCLKKKKKKKQQNDNTNEIRPLTRQHSKIKRTYDD